MRVSEKASDRTSHFGVNTAAAVRNLTSCGEKVIRLNALIALVDDPAVVAALNTELENIKQGVEEAINRGIDLDNRVFAVSVG